MRGTWKYLYRAIDKHGNPVDFLLTANRDINAAKRFFNKMLKDEPLLSPGKIGTDGANTFPSTIKQSVDKGHQRRILSIMSPSICSNAKKVTISG